MAWAFAHGGQAGSCLFKSKCEDFRVDEELPFEPEGEGEHSFLLVEKKGENTDWVAGQLADYAGVQRQSVSYAGRKDRQGVTRQWFCVTLPGLADPDWSALPLTSVKVLKQARHRKKLRTGALKGNRFEITLRKVMADRGMLEALLTKVSHAGVPNYYGEQRFGFGGRNLNRALALFDGKLRVNRNKRSIYLSAARSWLFNRIISERVINGSWDQFQFGDVLGFCDSNSLIFDTSDSGITERVESGDLSPTAALWGRGEPAVTEQILALEKELAAKVPSLCNGLEHAGLKQERRITRLIPENMIWNWQEDDSLQLNFYLPKGCFATSVLRELLDCRELDTNDHTAV
ncbi:hypothetical protein ACH42_05850 [Endozoicomonas sp. (ex Bugula neritina AB1)]|nr:hypothetical protein ACH42_05850 [Endozoicomonas sp. (ex Bugula neritina AB1)]